MSVAGQTSLPESLLCSVLDLCPLEWLPPYYELGVHHDRGRAAHTVRGKLGKKAHWQLHDVIMKAFDVADGLTREESKFKYFSTVSRKNFEELHQLVKRAGLMTCQDLEDAALYNYRVFPGRRGEDCMAPGVKCSEVERQEWLKDGDTSYAHVACYFDEFSAHGRSVTGCRFPTAWMIRGSWLWVTLRQLAVRAAACEQRLKPGVKADLKYCLYFVRDLMPRMFAVIGMFDAQSMFDVPEVDCDEEVVVPSPHDWRRYNPLLYVDDFKARWLHLKSDKRRAKHGWPSQAEEVSAARKILVRLVVQSGWTCCVCGLTEPRVDVDCVCSRVKCACWWDAVRAVVHAPEYAPLFQFPVAALQDMRAPEGLEVVRDGDDRKLMNDVLLQMGPPSRKRRRADYDTDGGSEGSESDSCFS